MSKLRGRGLCSSATPAALRLAATCNQPTKNLTSLVTCCATLSVTCCATPRVTCRVRCGHTTMAPGMRGSVAFGHLVGHLRGRVLPLVLPVFGHRAPLRLRLAVREEVPQQHVVKLQPLGLHHRAHQAGALEVLGQPLLARLCAHDDHLLRAKLDLRGGGVGAEQQQTEILEARAADDLRPRTLEEPPVVLQLVDGGGEVVLDELHGDVGQLEQPGVRAVVVDQLVDVFRRRRPGGAALRRQVEQTPQIREPERQPAGDGLRRVSRYDCAATSHQPTELSL
eukprot:1189477-Prorocentrum_minimum.AAC.2